MYIYTIFVYLMNTYKIDISYVYSKCIYMFLFEFGIIYFE